MTVASMVRRLLRGEAAERHVEQVEREIGEQKALIRQNTQALQSGSRVMGTMAGMMQMMTEADRGTDR